MLVRLISVKKLETEVSKQAMEACEHILSEMGAELHDDLIQKLSVLRLHMDKIERSSYHPKDTQEAMIKMQADFQGIIDSVRQISRRLHPVKMNEDSFNKRIEMLCQNMDTSGSVRIHPSYLGMPLNLSTVEEAYLLRMVQELIHNAFRHSAAWHIWIRVLWEPTILKIEVEDDGSGFSKVTEFVTVLNTKHNTLRMRAQAIGASIKYTPGDKGLMATIRKPLK
jgi:signal transduction histidine kinase